MEGNSRTGKVYATSGPPDTTPPSFFRTKDVLLSQSGVVRHVRCLSGPDAEVERGLLERLQRHHYVQEVSPEKVQVGFAGLHVRHLPGRVGHTVEVD